MKVIMGVDPGLAVTGYGIIRVTPRGCEHVLHGTVRTKPADGIGSRLLAIRERIRSVAVKAGVTEAAIEIAFVGANVSSAMALGQARAAAIIGLAEVGIAVAEYAPNLVKQTVGGYGHGAKDQVAFMVQAELGLPTIPASPDATDALAVALTHWAMGRYQ